MIRCWIPDPNCPYCERTAPPMKLPPTRYFVAAFLGLIPGAILCIAMGDPGLLFLGVVAGAVGVAIAVALAGWD